MPKVLIVDDSLTVRKVVERILESRQMQVLQAGLGMEAIERIERDQPDLVVCDVLLPDKEGYDVCQFVKSDPRLDRIPVLLISGIVNAAVIDRAERVGSAGVMQKPFSAEELARKVNDLLGQGPAPPREAFPGNGLAAAAAVLSTPAASSTSRSTPRPESVVPVVAARLPEPTAPSLEGCLTGLAAADGVHSVVLVDREGQVLGAAGNGGAAAALGAMTACLMSASDELGVELGGGQIQGLILEQGRGLVLLSAVGESGVLTIVLDEPAALGKARYYVKKAVPELLRVL
ncbi:MAG TPA: response regulator [Methylomirabilota bacterium]|jgi:CheY-like chemotaxis protein/predicted regulator of Ras-like GTPase activity (Roadblock/LC7/MglB family)|nr:response regulator [Methylomirabilota bacterium]